MFRLSSDEFIGSRIIIVEDDDQMARILEVAVREAGGSVVAGVATVEDGLKEAAQRSADQALVHVRYTSETMLNIYEVFARQGIRAVFVAGHDDWFSNDDDVEVAPPKALVRA